MEQSNHEIFMRRAIELSRQAALIERTGGVFGAVVVKNGEIIGEGYNQVLKQNDPTWHAEMEAIRQACKKVGSPHLDGCDLYTSAECCPMCLASAYWAHIRNIYYASTTSDALHFGNFADIDILSEICKDPKHRKIGSIQMMQPQAVAVWKEFSLMPNKAHY